MAEYYPLISRAVAGLREGAPEARRSIYDRARAALTGQLRGMQPAVPEEAVDRELAALDEAIARIEAEIAPGPTAAEAGPAAVEAALLLHPSPDGIPAPAVPAAPPASPVPAPPKPAQTSRPAAPLVARRTDPPPPRPSRPVFEPRASLPVGRPSSLAAGAARTRPPVPSDTKTAPVAEAAPAPAPAAPEPPPPSPLPPAPTLEANRSPDEFPVEAGPENGRGSVADVVPDRGPERRDEAVRPAMPPAPRETKPGNLRVYIVALAALAAVVAIALTAWKLRDTPEELARATPPVQPAESTPGKIVERADGSSTSDDANGPEATPAQPPVADAGSAQQSAAALPASTAATAPQPAGDQAIPIAYKAAILVAAPDTPERVKTYVGSVVWRSENVGQGQDQPLGTAVRADVDVPDAKLQLSMEIRKNTEAQFPASHTIDLKFTIASDSPVGAVKQIDVPQMRREDAATGDPLVGVPVTITNNYFLVGLTRGDAEARNIDAMKTRGWFDIPMVLGDGKPAKITFEKGASGDRVIADALAAWSRP